MASLQNAIVNFLCRIICIESGKKFVLYIILDIPMLFKLCQTKCVVSVTFFMINIYLRQQEGLKIQGGQNLISSTAFLKELPFVLQVKYDTPQVFLNKNEPFVLIFFDKFTINHINQKSLVYFQINSFLVRLFIFFCKRTYYTKER